MEGDNTSLSLLAQFNDVTLINKKPMPEEGVIVADYYTHKFDRKFDLIVLDLNIDCNIKMDWEKNFKHSFNNLSKNGSIICYAMVTDDYGNKDTPKMIRDHWKNYWGVKTLTLPDIVAGTMDKFILKDIQEDEKRGEIYWICLSGN